MSTSSKSPREWLVIEQSISRSVFAPEGSDKKGYVPRDVAEKALGRDLGGTVWFTAEEGLKMRALPEWSDTEPPGRTVAPPGVSPMTTALDSVLAERERQKAVEGILLTSGDLADWRSELALVKAELQPLMQRRADLIRKIEAAEVLADALGAPTLSAQAR